MTSQSYQTFRLRGVPDGYARRDVGDLVKRALSLATDARLKVYSLAANPYGRGKVATVVFNRIPDCFTGASGKESEWPFAASEDDDEDSNEIFVSFDSHFHGFTPLHREGDEPRTVDIVAISGLNGHAFGSFKERKGSFMWLRDLLANDLRTARILVYGYDTSLENSRSFQNLTDLGKAFHAGLRNIRVEGRPIILIGHSLGGLVIKEALINMKFSNNPMDLKILRSVCGILSFGVPNQGMAIASLVALVGNQPNRALLESLNGNSALLQRQHRELSDRLKGSALCATAAFYETSESSTASNIDGKWKMTGRPGVLVDVLSATHGCSMTYPIDRNHSDLVKLKRWDEEYYQTILHTVLHFHKIGLRTPSSSRPNAIQTSRSAERYSQECLQSLSFAEQESRQFEISAAENTCEWLINDHRYQSWLASSNGLIWIQGKPGAGKSTTMRFAVQKFKENCSAGNELVISFFIHGRGTTLQKTPLGLFRGLLHSLLQENPKLLPRLARRFVHRNDNMGEYGSKWYWVENELGDYLAEFISETSKSRPVVVFVDALDELGRSSAIEIVTFFEDIMARLQPEACSVRICFSCRHYPIISLQYGTTIYVEDQNTQDIRSVVQKRLGDIKPLPEDARESIKQDIVAKSGGVFQWAVLVVGKVQELTMRGTSTKLIQKRIHETPSELQALYANLLSDVDDQAQTVKLFQWVLFFEALNLNQLRHALAIDISVAYKSVAEIEAEDTWAESLEQLERTVRDLSKGLVEIIGDDKNRGEKKVQFIHQSVSDYLLTSGLDALKHHNLSGSQYSLGHFQISRSCLRYLALQEAFDDDSDTALPLLNDARNNLMQHLRYVEKEGIDQHDVLGLLPWLEDDTKRKHCFYYSPGWDFFPKNIVQFLSWCGLISALNHATSMNDARLKAVDDNGNSPLLLALKARQPWKENGPHRHPYNEKTTILAEKDRNPAQMLLDQTVKRLLELGQDPNWTNKNGWTPLGVAADSMSFVDVQLLLDAGAEVRFHKGQSATPLHVALQTENLKMFRQALSKTGDLEFLNPLCTAVQVCCEKDTDVTRQMLRELLEAECHPNAIDRLLSTTPLALAVRANKFDLIEVLLDGGADLFAHESAHIVPDIICSRNMELLQLLADRPDVELNKPSASTGSSALMLAVESGHEDIIRLLLSCQKLDIDKKDVWHSSPLSIAVEKHNISIIRTLLFSGNADPNIKGESDRLLLGEIAIRGDGELLDLFLSTGRVTPDLQDDNECTVLGLAVRPGNGDVISKLLDSKVFSADPTKDRNGLTPLLRAVECRSEVILELLSSAEEMSMISLREAYTRVEELYDRKIDRPKCQVMLQHLMCAMQRKQEEPKDVTLALVRGVKRKMSSSQ